MPIASNEIVYDKLWKNIKIRNYQVHPEWKIIKRFIRPKERLLEIGPGVRPKLPLSSSVFLDISQEAVKKLSAQGARAIKGSPEKIPFDDLYFNLICAFDVIEHIKVADFLYQPYLKFAHQEIKLIRKKVLENMGKIEAVLIIAERN